ncbi:MAG: FAA hydrolase family protein [Acidobacteria bacterium]|nr:MAG: FAA hydrolase family protein [Acidobacteriota bacterium]
MKLCRFDDGRLGLVEPGQVRDVTAALDVLPAYRYPLPPFDPLIANLDAVIARVRTVASHAPAVPLRSITLLSPVANPGKIVCAPVNYQKHLDEVRDNAALHHHNTATMAPIHTAGLFLKATSSLVGPGQGIALRKVDRRNDHEVELAVVIGRQASDVEAKDGYGHVAGYAIGLDITIRGPEERSLRKSPDSYAVLGPWLVTADEIPNPGALDLRISVNGDLRQSSNTKYLILGVPELIAYASSFYTLNPGDVIITGTPEGVSPIQPGDVITACIEQIGTMEVKVRAAGGVG